MTVSDWGSIYWQATFLYSSFKLKDQRGYTQKKGERDMATKPGNEAKGY